MKLKKGGRISFTNNLMKIMKKNKVLKNSHESREKKKWCFQTTRVSIIGEAMETYIC